MKKRYCLCFDMEPHKEHKWRVRWWNRPWICRGASYPNTVLTPNEVRSMTYGGIPYCDEHASYCEVIPEKPHRHSFKLTRLLMMPYNLGLVGVSRELVAWQCKCGEWQTRYRMDLKVQMLPMYRRWDQTWPS